jgi:hypothetical protein
MSLTKGLIAHYPLNSKSEKKGTVIINDTFESADSFSEINGTGSANNDSISDGSINKNNNYKYYANATNGLHYFQRNVGTLTAGKNYVLTMWYYIPSTNTTLKKIQLDLLTSIGSYIQIISSHPFQTSGSWNKLEVSIVPISNAGYIRMYGFTTGGSSSFVGANDSGDDIVYINNFNVSEVQTADTTPNANHGIVYGATQETDSMTFDGTDDRIKPSDIELGTTYTLSAWFNILDDSGRVIIGHGSNSSGTNYDRARFFPRIDGHLVYTHGFHTNQNGIEGGIITAGQWHHGVVVYDKTNAYLYLDGDLVGSQSNFIEYDLDNNLNIGCRFDASSASLFFNGSIKDVRIYNRALTTTEINRLYKEGL